MRAPVPTEGTGGEPRLTCATRLVSRLRSSLCTEDGEAPGWQGAKSEHIGNIRTMSNAARSGAPVAAAATGWRRDASPAECQRTSETRH